MGFDVDFELLYIWCRRCLEGDGAGDDVVEDDADEVCSSSSSVVVDGVSESSSMSRPSIILSYALKSKRRKDTLAVSLDGAGLDSGLVDILYGRSVGSVSTNEWGWSE